MAGSRNSGSSEATERDKIIKAIYAAKISPQESLNKSEEAEDAIDFDKKNTELSYQNRIAKKNNRRVWNWTLLVLVIIGFVTSYIMIFLIGFGVMRFENNSFAVPAVVGAGVLETYGLAKLAVQYFFSDNDSSGG